MMLHVFPSKCDPGTHHLGDEEKMAEGDPVFIDIAFGGALSLCADAAHGGCCVGSVENFRFHMMLWAQDCPLVAERLHLLKTLPEKRIYAQAVQHHFRKRDLDEAFLDAWNNTAAKCAMRACIEAVKNLHPEEDTGTKLFKPVHHLHFFIVETS
jgi:hypothetical protein